MRYLVQELGPESFREELAKRVSVGLTPAGEDLTKRYRGDHIGVHPQRRRGGSRTAQPGTARYYVGLNVPVGRMSGEQFEEAGRLAGEYGDGVRLATDQNLIVTGVPEDRLDDLLAEPLLTRYSPSLGASSVASWPVRGASSAAMASSRPRSGPWSGPARWTRGSAFPARRP